MGALLSLSLIKGISTVLKMRKQLAIQMYVFQLEVMMSSFVFRLVWSWIRDSKATKYVLLLMSPAFVKPLEFGLARRPIHLRLKWLWGLPLVVAGVWAALAGSSLEWAYGNSAGPGVSVAEALKAVGQLKTVS